MNIVQKTDALDGARAPSHTLNTKRTATSSGTPCGKGEHSVQFVELNELDRLHRSLSEVTPEIHPRTAKLLASSRRKVAQKVFEEAGEVALEAVQHDGAGIVRESADLLYHLVALWYCTGIHPDDVWAEMRRRAEAFGIAEKLPKEAHSHSDARPRGSKQVGGGNERDM